MKPPRWMRFPPKGQRTGNQGQCDEPWVTATLKKITEEGEEATKETDQSERQEENQDRVSL